jgi:hypothetical protein
MGGEQVTNERECSGGPGCISTIIGLMLIWALLCGVNYGGKHYGVSCKGDGLTIERTDRP